MDWYLSTFSFFFPLPTYSIHSHKCNLLKTKFTVVIKIRKKVPTEKGCKLKKKI